MEDNQLNNVNGSEPIKQEVFDAASTAIDRYKKEIESLKNEKGILRSRIMTLETDNLDLTKKYETTKEQLEAKEHMLRNAPIFKKEKDENDKFESVSTDVTDIKL